MKIFSNIIIIFFLFFIKFFLYAGEPLQKNNFDEKYSYEEIYKIEKKGQFISYFSNIHGTIKSFKLLNPQYFQKKKPPYRGVPAHKLSAGPMDMISTWDFEYYPYQIDFEIFQYPEKIKRKIKSNPEHPLKEGDFIELYRIDPIYSVVNISSSSITFVWPDPKTDESLVFIEKHYEIFENYRIALKITIYNFSSLEVREQIIFKVYAWQAPDIEEGGLFSPAVDIYNAIVYAGGEIERKSPDEIHSRVSFLGTCKWGGIDSRYFLLSAISENLENVQCSAKGYENGVIETVFHETQPNRIPATKKSCVPFWLKDKLKGFPSCDSLRAVLGVEKNGNLKKALKKKILSSTPEKIPVLEDAYERLLGLQGIQYSWIFYIGPKDIGILRKVGYELEDSIDFWVLGFLCKPMLYLLRLFYDLIPLWSIAIALLTLLVKLATLYWSEKSYRQMEKMQKLKPMIDEIKEKYKNQKQRLNQELINLYKREKVNPLGGCLPMLLQMPIWIALYRTIYGSVDLYQAPLFGWIRDLSAPDPYYVLPLFLGGVMFLQQKMTPLPGDSSQAKIMLYLMPIMFTVFMLFLPSGLTYYILVTTIFGIIHQWITKKRSKKNKT